jgi:hypothetical protein
LGGGGNDAVKILTLMKYKYYLRDTKSPRNLENIKPVSSTTTHRNISINNSLRIINSSKQQQQSQQREKQYCQQQQLKTVSIG